MFTGTVEIDVSFLICNFFFEKVCPVAEVPCLCAEVPCLWRAWTNSRAHKRPDCGARMSLSPPLPPPTSPPKSDDFNLNLLILLVPLVVLVQAARKRKEIAALFHQQRVFQLQDPLHPEHLSEISPPELAEKPALFNKFMEADRLDIVSQDTGSQVSKALSDQVSKDIKERRENWHYFPKGIRTAKCYINSDIANDPPEAWQYLGQELLRKCKETNGKLIILITPECKKVKRQAAFGSYEVGEPEWVGEPRLTPEQVKQKQQAICLGVDVREIEIRAGDDRKKVFTLVLSNVMMEKQQAEQFMAAERVHVLSTQFQATQGARELAKIADAILDGIPGTFCYNPNEDSAFVAEGRKDLADGMWAEIWNNMAQHASAKSNLTNKKRPGKVFQLILDGVQTSNQYQEENWATEKGVEVVKIHADVSCTEEQLRPILMKHARA